MDLNENKERLLRYLSYEIKDKRVLAAMNKIPREQFVPDEYRETAYDDRPMPIGMGQTISQPFIIALMTQALELTGTEKVLEIGCGSGYQAAILAELASRVVTVERFPSLLTGAEKRLHRLGYNNIEYHISTEELGWPKGAPYDRILVTAGAPKVPPELLQQLAAGGIIVIPVGSRYEQELIKINKKEKGVATESLGLCRFVPLVGKGAWESE